MTLFHPRLLRWRWRNWRGGHRSSLASSLGRGYRQLPLLALDLELTGLDPAKDEIVSIGAIPIEQGRLRCQQAFYQLVRTRQSVGQSATIHGIVDHQLERASGLHQGLASLWPLLQGRVLVCHNAGLDLAFLRRDLARELGQREPLLAVDTLALEQRRLQRQGQTLQRDDLTLAACRRRYGLPEYPGHNALVDALACGELLLAQASALGQNPGLAELIVP
ncbi:DNA polymerase-3 subunit epsilon [Ferrimonas sediminum]|uniref:DNA polymerase-3 subunit epsilon n=1 Tax=Ferrimonas sediminum TaxID=718193 RepID=A0A1G9AH23_9GAMM|nr:exonuclease domain-containing protein [Ferrimonas sediminum]SDK25850.1 DNA polymerase-3 subunit epsilon [Ferrimonas sediminum]